MLNHKHRFYATIDETIECFDTKCDFKITKDRLWELLELGLKSAQQSFAPDSSKAGDLNLPESVKVENDLPAESG